MTGIYIVRHCEAMGNVRRIFQGLTDLDISENGEKQLECLKNRFSDIPLDKIYSSPLIRTRKTAEAIRGDRNIEIEVFDGLIEINGGILEGMPFADSFKKHPDLADAWDNHPEDFHPEQGELMSDAYERIWDAVLSIAKKNKGKTIACATHGGVTRCLNCRLSFGDIKKLKDTDWSDNTAVSYIEFDDDFSPKLIFANDTSHLPKELLVKRIRISRLISGEAE